MVANIIILSLCCLFFLFNYSSSVIPITKKTKVSSNLSCYFCKEEGSTHGSCLKKHEKVSDLELVVCNEKHRAVCHFSTFTYAEDNVVGALSGCISGWQLGPEYDPSVLSGTKCLEFETTRNGNPHSSHNGIRSLRISGKMCLCNKSKCNTNFDLRFHGRSLRKQYKSVGSSRWGFAKAFFIVHLLVIITFS